MLTDWPTTGHNYIFGLLESKNAIYIKQICTGRECIEMLTGCEMSNRFEIKDSHGAPDAFFKLTEESGCLIRQCFAIIHPFDINLTLSDDDTQTPQIIYHRDFHCTNVTCLCSCGWQCNCCAFDSCYGTQVMDILNSNRNVIGRVREEPRAWCGLTSWGYYDSQDTRKFLCTVECAEFCKMCCCQDVKFACTRYGTEDVVATITRKCICTVVDIATDKDHFEVKYKPGAALSPEDKFGIMSIGIIVKYMHFQGDS